MKKLLFIFLAFGIVVAGFAQQRTYIKEELRNKAVRNGRIINASPEFTKTPGLPAYKNALFVEETTIGATRYDLQTNTSNQNRIHVFDDGTIGAAWTMGIADPNFADRGTGYNYFDGNAWGPAPGVRIESIRTGWPSYAPYGENGEMVVSHDFGVGSLIYLTRENKGTGSWTENELVGPTSVPISWNRSTSSGIDNGTMQILAITWPTANTGPIYEGLDGALLYSRSSDGGATWDPENEILDGLGSDDFFGFSADEYEWAASNDDNIAFIVGDSWKDFVLMKSTDNGDSWEKTIIWECPYPLFNTTTPPFETDTFYCVDGAHHLAFDSQGKVHVVFGINRAYSDGAGTFYFPGVDGVGYWNEDMPVFSNDINALSPYGDPGTELIEDVNLVGWTQDINGNGEIDVLDDWGTYYIGFSSMPQIVIDDMDQIFIVFSSVTETFNNGLQNYRHLWARAKSGNWWYSFIDLTGNLAHIFDECIVPSVASETDDYFYLVYQSDNEPGLHIRGDEDPVGDNNTVFMKVNKSDLLPTGIEEGNAPIVMEDVSQNYPNPFTGETYVNINLRQSASVSLEVADMLGKVVYRMPEKKAVAGSLRLEIDASELVPGVYFYSVKAGDSVVTKKMVIE